MKLPDKHALHRWINHRADKQQENVWLFTLGAVGFFIGMGIILWAENSLQASLGQEIITLIGLLITSIGGVTSAIGYLSLSVFRFYRLATNDSAKQAKSPSSTSDTD